MAPPQTQNSASCCAKTTMILLWCLPFFVIYCYFTFPTSLKDVSAEEFNSHPLRDLSKFVQSSNTLKDAKLYNDQLIGICQDIQINKNGLIYCVTMDGKIISIDPNTNQTKKIQNSFQGMSYGCKLSTDEKILYFINSQKGLCQVDLLTNEVTSLASQYNNKLLQALNSIEVHPKNSNIIFFTQTNPLIPMYLHGADLMLNRPYGKIFKFNKETKQLEVIAEKFYFANGILFQQYKGEETVLVAETNRYRLLRIYLTGPKKGERQVAIDKLDMFLDNMKMNKNGDIWVAGPSPRDTISHFADHNPLLRTLLARLPHWLFGLLANKKYIAGVKLSFDNTKQNISPTYYIWEALPGFSFATTIYEFNDSLYVSSLVQQGVLVINNYKDLQHTKGKIQVNQQVSNEL